MVGEDTDFVFGHPGKTQDGIHADLSLIKVGLKGSGIGQFLPAHDLFEKECELCGSFAPLQLLPARGDKTEGFPGSSYERIIQKFFLIRLPWAPVSKSTEISFSAPLLRRTRIFIKSCKSSPAVRTLFNWYDGIS